MRWRATVASTRAKHWLSILVFSFVKIGGRTTPNESVVRGPITGLFCLKPLFGVPPKRPRYRYLFKATVSLVQHNRKGFPSSVSQDRTHDVANRARGEPMEFTLENSSGYGNRWPRQNSI